MLAVLTGPVRSGKSSAGLRLALDSGAPVTIVVGARDDDEEMRRRIARHRAERPAGVTVVEAIDDRWRELVPADACLLVDCLGTVLGSRLWQLVPEDAEVAGHQAEERAEALADDLVAWLVGREAPTVVVTNEVGWGVVPATPLGRLFRDVLARANRRLVDAADAAWLVVAGRCIEMTAYKQEVAWPHK
ncbi:bifunctional adenosylcobinamide kinase/adenosylcobinamide-phosphate guanylyltransferase [bacterium]|nr:bifunctional adenosylcobinamide kinase/adenosylcobinamide-phosphate guanylyltransferase [bacterium]